MILRRRQSRKDWFGGFTLVELLVAIAIIAVLAGLLLPALSRGLEQSRRTKCIGNLKQLALALSMYADDFEVYPLELTVQASPKQSYIWDEPLVPYTQSNWTNALYRCPTYRGPTIGGAPVAISVSDGVAHMAGGIESRIGSYSYNAFGTSLPQKLGLGGTSRLFDTVTLTDRTIPRRAAKIVMPSEMLAIGDSQSGYYYYYWMPATLLPKNGFSHGQRLNVSFCDGHVETRRASVLFAPTAESRSQWNYDHDPHLP